MNLRPLDRIRRTLRPRTPEARLKSIMDAAGELCVIVADPDGTITEFSRAAEELHGITAADVIGKMTLGELVSNQDAGRDTRAQNERDALVRVSREVAANRNPGELWSLIAQEVGRLHGARAAGVIRFDSDGTGTVIGAWSLQGRLTVGTVLNLAGKTATARVSHTGAYAVRLLSQPRRGEAAPGSPDEHDHALGISTPILVNGRLLGAISISVDTDAPAPVDVEASLGRFADLVSLAIVNTEHRDALERGRDELTQIIDGLPALIWVTDPLGCFVLTNRTFDEVTSATNSPYDTGSRAFVLIDEALDAKAMRAGKSVHSEQTVTDGHGNRRTFLVARSPLTSREGDVYALCCVATDITERREIEIAKDEFVSVVSHELRTPLSSIQGALSLLSEEASELPPEAGRRMLEIALQNSERLMRLINDILDLQKITAGKAELEPRDCNGADLVAEAAASMSSFALERQVRIEVVRENTPLNADVDRVLQVLNNLLSNAVKFSSAATAVRIGVASLDGEARFFVHNHGRPIPADKLEMIFERFQQVDSSDSRNVGGTGLGLAICREIAEQHRGRVWAESGQDRGTTFWLALPMTPALDDGVRPAPGGGLIVACDGSPGGRAELKEMVESLGYGVLEARTGAAALDMARSERPTAIVLNLALPSAEAIETLGALAGDDAIADIPVLMIDGLGISVSTTVTTDGEGSSLEDLLHRFSLAALPEAAGRILVVEHDEARASRLLTRLEEDERWVHRARTAAEAVAMAKGIRPDLALVNIGLPSGDGFTVVDALVDGDLRPGALMVYSAARFVNPTPGAVETSALHADV